MRRTQHIIFDLDGTLVDSAPGILSVFSAVLAARCIRPRCELDSRLIGPPLAESLARISGIDNATELAVLADDFKHRYDAEGVAATLAYEGVGTLLKEVERNDCVLHIATNKRIAPTRAIVERLGWQRYFASLHALDLYEPRLPDKARLLACLLAERGLSPDVCIYIGDTPEDGRAADSNALRFVAATWGYGNFYDIEFPLNWSRASKPLALVEMLLG